MHTTRIIEQLSTPAFQREFRRKGMVLGAHIFDRLADQQRDVFETEILSRTTRQKPAFVGRQENGRLAVLYRKKRGYLKLILVEKSSGFEAITFINVASIPSIEREK